MKQLTHGELFAGIGGFGLGADSAGMKTIWHVEIDKAAQSVLTRRFPGTQLDADVTQVGAHNLPTIDVLTFGSPCQDLSIAGQRKGMQDGTRSNLFFEAARIIRELNPAVAVWENVPGALSSNRGEDFRAVLSEMLGASVPMPRSGRWAAAGMARSGSVDLAWRILDAQYFGVAQRRRRIILVADFRGQRAAEILFEPESLSGNTPPSRETGQGIAETAQRNARDESESVLGFGLAQITSKANYSNPKYGDPMPPLNLAAQSHVAVMAHGQANAEILQDQSPTLNANHEQPIVAIANWTSGGGKMDDNIAATIRAGAEHNAQFVWEMQHASEAYRETAGNIAPTLQSRMGTGGNNVPLVGIRRLTPLECERLQGFPDGWTDGQSDSARYKQLGNAVAVPVAAWVCKRIAEALI